MKSSSLSLLGCNSVDVQKVCSVTFRLGFETFLIERYRYICTDVNKIIEMGI